MPGKRRIVELLTRTELLDLVERFELAIEDRRVKDGLVDAVARSHRVSLADVLPQYSRERLRALCVALDLDSGGREKVGLVDRLLGKATGDSTASAGEKSRAGAKAEQVVLPPKGKLTVDQLEGYLWSAICDLQEYRGRA